MEISILNDYSEYPGLRHCTISEFSGEDFYHKILNRAFKQALDANEKLIVNLDGTAGYASSFLDEAFGNLVYDYALEIVKSRVIIISEEEPSWKEMIETQTYPQWENRRKQNKEPKVTQEHKAWYRMVNKIIEQKVWSK